MFCFVSFNQMAALFRKHFFGFDNMFFVNLRLKTFLFIYFTFLFIGSD